MRPDRAILPFAFVIAGLPAAAQDCATGLNPLLAALGMPPLGAAVAAPDGWCRLTDLRLGGQRTYAPLFTIDDLSFRLTGGFAADGDDVTLPQGIDLTVAGLRIGVATGDPLMDWLMAAQRVPNPISGTLSISADPATRAIRLTALDIDFPGDNAISLAASLTGLDPRSGESLVLSLPQGRLHELDLTVTSNGLFEGYALMPLGNVLLSGAPDPGQTVAGMKATLTAYIAGLPDSVLSAPGRDALTDLIADLPNPAGTLRLAINAPGGLGAERLAPVVIGGVQAVIANPAPLFDGIDLMLTYDRTAPAEGDAP